MEDQVERAFAGAEFLLHVHLAVVQDVRAQLDVAGLVHAVHVAESGCDGEARADLAQLLVGIGHLFRLGVQARAVDAGVVDAVFLAAGHAQLDLQGHIQLAHPLQVALADFDVLVQRLFRQVEHVRAEQRLAVGLVVGLARIQQAIHPRQQLLGAVVGVDHHPGPVQLSQVVDVHGGRDGAGDAGALPVVVQPFAGVESRPAVGELDDDR